MKLTLLSYYRSLSSSFSYQVLYYNLSSSGLQTVSVLRCDWEGEVVVMECTQNGQQDGEWSVNFTSQTMVRWSQRIDKVLQNLNIYLFCLSVTTKISDIQSILLHCFNCLWSHSITQHCNVFMCLYYWILLWS